jgi:outer membrane receptor protein involved in Fe transport
MPDPTIGFASFSDPDSFSDILFATSSAPLIEEILDSTANVFNATAIDFSDPAVAAAQLAALPNFFVFDNRLHNLDQARLDGFDLDVAYDLNANWGELNFGVRLTYLADYEEKISPNAPTTTVVDTVVRPVDLKGRAYAAFAREGVDAAIAANYVDDYRNPYGLGQQRVGSWTTWDARIAFELEYASSVLDGVSLSFAVQNLFDRNPPFVTQSGVPGLALRAPIGFDHANANPIGRFVAVGLVKRW